MGFVHGSKKGVGVKSEIRMGWGVWGGADIGVGGHITTSYHEGMCACLCVARTF